MKSCENNVNIKSEYFIYSVSSIAKEMFLYPVHIGHFFYEPQYTLNRSSFDSFLILFIKNGSMEIYFEGKNHLVTSGSFMLMDCYKPHTYKCDSSCETIWCHFDGILARKYYECIVSHLGNFITLPDPNIVINKLNSIYNIFYTHSPIKEALLSKYLNDILTTFLLFSPKSVNGSKHINMTEDIISYINEHFSEDISISDLASIANLSQYHFIRTFKKETGSTPHEYLINTRISNAKYLLKNSKLPVKDICFDTGFSCESVFCSAFKKHVGLTPAEYRHISLQIF